MQNSSLQTYPWHNAALTQWQQLVHSQRLPHAILLSGAPGLGKSQLVKHLLANLWCDQNACSQCRHCQWLLQDSHADCRWLRPEEDAKNIKIDDIRDACEWLQLSPFHTQKKVLIIQPAETLNTAASNALLKTLEEPSATSLIILISEQPQQLLATVRSRCYKLALSFPDEATIKNWIAQNHPELAKASLLPGLGPLALIQAYQSDKADQQQKLFSTFDAVLNKQISFVEAAEQLKSIELSVIIQALNFFVIEKVKYLTQQQQLASLTPWLKLEEALIEAKKFVLRGANLNSALQCEVLMQKLGNL